MKTAPSKWAVGGPMIEWCERNGLDASRIPDRPDAIVVRDDRSVPHVALIAEVWHVLCDGDPPVLNARQWRSSGDEVEYVRVVPVDSEPPLTPEWVALFGPDAPPRPPSTAYDTRWAMKWTTM